MTLRDQLVDGLLRDLAASPDRKGELVRDAAAKAAVSADSIYRWLKAAGWSSGRKPRADKGSSVVPPEALRDVSRVLAAGRNARGEPNIPLTQAQRILGETGHDAGAVSRAHLNRLLNQSGLGLRHMTAPTPAIQRQSQHPNHVWMVDYSPAIQWYFRDETGAKRLELHRDGGARFASKPANVRALRRILHRFCTVDHYSGAIFVRYYYTSGERAEDVVDFLAHAMGEKSIGRSRFPMRGVPRRLVFDQGSANKSAVVLNMLASLGVTVEHHAPGNAKASGAVEKAHHIWQQQFEARMALEPATDLDTLNGQAERFAAHLNATAEHSRTRFTRSGLWSTITGAQLVEAPPRTTIISLATTSTKEAVLTNQLWLRHGGRAWHIAGANVIPSQRVKFRLTPLQAPGIAVTDEHGRPLAATPIELDARSGFVISGAPRHVWDDETHAGASVPAPPAQHIAAEVAANNTPITSVRSVFEVPDQHLESVAFRPVQGRAWEPPAEAVPVAPVLLSPLEAKLVIADRLGRALGDDAPAWSAAIGDGITEDELEALLASDNSVAEVG